MTLPNDSILVSPGSGATLATHLASAKEYEAWLTANAAGEFADPVGTWGVAQHQVGASDGQSTSTINRLSILNADASLIVEVLSVWGRVIRTSSTLLGVATRARLQRMTGHSGGSTLTPSKIDSTTGSLDADITVRSGRAASNVTITGATGEELSSATAMVALTGMSEKFWLWNLRQEGLPIILRQNEGVFVSDFSDASDSTVSFINYGFTFRVR